MTRESPVCLLVAMETIVSENIICGHCMFAIGTGKTQLYTSHIISDYLGDMSIYFYIYFELNVITIHQN